MDYEDRHALVSLVSFKNVSGAAAEDDGSGDGAADNAADDDDDDDFFSSVKRGIYGQVSGC